MANPFNPDDDVFDRISKVFPQEGNNSPDYGSVGPDFEELWRSAPEDSFLDSSTGECVLNDEFTGYKPVTNTPEFTSLAMWVAANKSEGSPLGGQSVVPFELIMLFNLALTNHIRETSSTGTQVAPTLTGQDFPGGAKIDQIVQLLLWLRFQFQGRRQLAATRFYEGHTAKALEYLLSTGRHYHVSDPIR